MEQQGKIAEPTRNKAVSSSTDKNNDITIDANFLSLVKWIQSYDNGFVHENLILKTTNDGAYRGIYAKKAIPKGEMLISLPQQLSINGMGVKHESAQEAKNASNWLRCLSRFYEANSSAENFFQPYIKSLPDRYESLLNWSDEEVKNFLGGTTISHAIIEDRKGNILESRYKDAVKPYLKNLDLLRSFNKIASKDDKKKEEEEITFFKNVCMCISTRGFHLDEGVFPDGFKNNAISDYGGPFLLPLIDLLNHDPLKKCTTLRFDVSTSCFRMVAECNIAEKEEVYHSYGSDLSSAQVLQTFGFVPDNSIHNALNRKLDDTKSENISPTVISKSEITSAYQILIKSSFADSLYDFMENSKVFTEDDERWKLDSNILDRDLSSLQDNFLVTYQNPLCDELLTACVILLLPSTVYDEFVSDGIAVVDESILEDYFLGKLLCQLILHIISLKAKKLKEMEKISKTIIRSDDKITIQDPSSSSHKEEFQRALYGLTIRIEEKSCLQQLQDKVISVGDSLGGFPLVIIDGNLSVNAIKEESKTDNSSSKKVRTE